MQSNDDRLAAILQDPDLLWSVLNARIKVGGPWQRRGDGWARFRPGTAGGDTPFMAHLWQMATSFTVYADGLHIGYCDTPEEGKRMCDEHLRGRGVLLVGDVHA